MKKILVVLALFPVLAVSAQSARLDTIKALFAEREDLNKVDECIRICEEEMSKEVTREVAVYLSRCYYIKGENETEKKPKLELYLKGVDAGEKGMNTIPRYVEAIESEKKEEKAIAKLQKEDIDAMYWIAANIARYAKFAPFGKKLAVKGRVKYLWTRVLELDPTYNYGGVYRFWGGYYALVPSITGEQDPVKSKEMFDKGVELAPQYLDTKVLYAEAYCTHGKIKNRDLFKQLLNEVLSEDISKYPDIMPENKIAQQKAKDLLAQESDLFD